MAIGASDNLKEQGLENKSYEKEYPREEIIFRVTFSVCGDALSCSRII